MTEICPCCSNLIYAKCCEPYHLNMMVPATPEKLMRSRYSAYVMHLVAYLMQTTHPLVRYLYDEKEIENWAKANTWLKLEICVAQKDKVEFKAQYQNGLNTTIHHEISTFKKDNGVWYYLKGIFFNQN
jgi:SEC-C motif-containing protein